MSTLNNTTTTTFLEATAKLAVFGAKGASSLVGGASGVVIAASDTLAAHIDSAPDSISAGINKRSIGENFTTMRNISYRGTRRAISNYTDDGDEASLS